MSLFKVHLGRLSKYRNSWESLVLPYLGTMGSSSVFSWTQWSSPCLETDGEGADRKRGVVPETLPLTGGLNSSEQLRGEIQANG